MSVSQSKGINKLTDESGEAERMSRRGKGRRRRGGKRARKERRRERRRKREPFFALLAIGEGLRFGLG